MAQGGNQRRQPVPGTGFRRAARPVLDTNVILALYSCHDLTQLVAQRLPHVGNAPGEVLQDQRVIARIERAREALLMALYLCKMNATTVGLHHELVGILEARVPPSELPTHFESAFTTVFIHFVKSRVLAGWNHAIAKNPGHYEGDAADRALVKLAMRREVPPISYEGYSHTGEIDESKLVRRESREKGVLAMLPRDFFAQRIDVDAEIDAFLLRFRELAPPYILSHRKIFGDDGNEDLVKAMFG